MISFLSRIAPKNEPDSISGYGFELTFRLRKASETGSSSQDIPLWPCKVLQHLAKYIFQTGSRFHAGHHIPFGHILPSLYSSKVDTHIHDLLITNDRQLKSFHTELGSVEFLQVDIL
jgi:molybdopterin-guanine dinucleotide biosynthesis protein A